MNNSDSHEGTKTRRDAEELSSIVVDCGYKLHVEAGPGLLESVYEIVLAKMLVERGIEVQRQVPVPIRLMGLTFDEGFRADLIVEDRLLVELKSVETFAPVHFKQVLAYNFKVIRGFVRGEAVRGANLPPASQPSPGPSDQFRFANIQRRLQAHRQRPSILRDFASSCEPELGERIVVNVISHEGTKTRKAKNAGNWSYAEGGS